MRNDNDRVKIKVQAYFIADIDLERVEQDPRWQLMTERLDLSDKEVINEQLFKYVNSYILAGPQVLTNAPFTNGPSDIWVSTMEILDDRSNPRVS
jgi:hypothetical protein